MSTTAAASSSATKRTADDATTDAAAKKAKTTVTVEQLLALSGVPADRSYLLETDVGISTFLNPLQTAGRLTAIIKHRFTDFLVNEVDPAGNVLHLTAEDSSATQQKPSSKEKFDIASIDESVWTELKSFFDDDAQDAAIEKVKEILVNGPPKFARKKGHNNRDGKDAKKEEEEEEEKKEPELLTKVYAVKEDRVKVYDFFKKHFFERLSTDSRNTQRICVRAFTNRDRQRSLPRPDFSASGPGEHLSFILYKENKDTMECLNQLARVTGTLSTAYTFAGTKDKRGVTVQKCSGYRVYQSKLEGAYLGPGVKIGGFKYVKDRVNLGDLSGNEFVITLRDVALATDHETETDIPKILETSLTSLAESGFINYYGMQRFGTRNISTHQVGLAMLASSWETAVDIIMMPKGDEKPDFVAARNLWMEKRDYKECLKVFPRSCIAERAILTAMQKSKRSDDYYGALQAIPRNLRLMYLHAVQSFVWNHAASERIRLYGNKVVKGDLVAKFNPLAQSNASKVTPEDTGDAEAAEITAIEEHRQGRMIEVELVETDEQAATKSIEDLVLPLPGHAVKYPTNEIGEFYKSFMAKYGLDPHDMKRKQRETSLTGDYRRVIIKPKNVSWKSLRYDDPNFPLSMTDLDRINGAPEPVSVPDGKRLGVIVSFTLETSSYATMALREILRSDTGAGFQSVMSNKSKVETDAERAALEDSA